MEEMKELKELMLGGFQQINHRMDKIETRIDRMETRMGSMDANIQSMQSTIGTIQTTIGTMQSDISDLKSSQLRMETDMKNNFAALYDARGAQLDTNEKVMTSLIRIETKLDRADMRALYAANRVDRIAAR